MKKILCLLIVIELASCSNVNKITKNDFIGTWHLVSISDGFVDKGVLSYSPDNQMIAILSKNDSMLIGYSGKYEINYKVSYVTHYRDFYSILPYPEEIQNPIFIRDFSFSSDKQTLTLKPREEKGLELIWKKFSK